jgi:DNA repair exonuclease SbcCD ATPase subunit
MSAARLGLLTIRNLQSYGNNTTSINLNFNKAALILGRNIDSMVDGQIDSNGSGKSTILAAIVYVLYDKTLDSDIKINDLINKINGKNLRVTLELEKDGFYYKIDRYRKLDKEGTGVYLLKKDSPDVEWDYKKHDVTQAGNINVEDEIVKLIGFPFEIFIRILAITASSKPFLKLELSKQREITEELFGFTELSIKAEKLKQIIKDNNSALELLEKLDEQIKGEIERHNNQLATLAQKVKAWDELQTRKIITLQTQIKEDDRLYGHMDFDAEERKFIEISEIQDAMTKLSNSILLKQKSLAVIEKQIKEAEAWNVTHAAELSRLQKEISKPLVFKTIQETQEFDKALKEFDVKASDIDKLIVELDKKISNEMTAIKSLKSDIKLLDQKIETKQNKLGELNHELIHLQDSKCPYCSQPFLESKDKLSTTTDIIKQMIFEIETLESSKADKQDKITKHEGVLETLLSEKDAQTELKQSAVKEKQDFIVEILGSTDINLKQEYDKTLNREKIINQLQSKEKETNPYLKDVSLDDLNEEKDAVIQDIDASKEVINIHRKEEARIFSTMRFRLVTEIAPTKLQIENRRNELVALESEVNPHADSYHVLNTTKISSRKTEEIQTLHDTIKHDEFLLKVLTKKDSFVRKALINRYVPFLNERIKYYLSKLGLPHKVQFKQDMTVGITQFKSEISFSSLSSGQKARVNIALNFSFRDVLQSRYGTINFCILDEILDVGLGSTGVQLAVKMIKSWIKDNGLSAFVISHRDEIASNFDNKLVVELKNGFSNVVYSDI